MSNYSVLATAFDVLSRFTFKGHFYDDASIIEPSGGSGFFSLGTSQTLSVPPPPGVNQQDGTYTITPTIYVPFASPNKWFGVEVAGFNINNRYILQASSLGTINYFYTVLNQGYFYYESWTATYDINTGVWTYTYGPLIFSPTTGVRLFSINYVKNAQSNNGVIAAAGLTDTGSSIIVYSNDGSNFTFDSGNTATILGENTTVRTNRSKTKLILCGGSGDVAIQMSNDSSNTSNYDITTYRLRINNVNAFPVMDSVSTNSTLVVYRKRFATQFSSSTPAALINEVKQLGVWVSTNDGLTYTRRLNSDITIGPKLAADGYTSLPDSSQNETSFYRTPTDIIYSESLNRLIGYIDMPTGTSDPAQLKLAMYSDDGGYSWVAEKLTGITLNNRATFAVKWHPVLKCFYGSSSAGLHESLDGLNWYLIGATGSANTGDTNSIVYRRKVANSRFGVFRSGNTYSTNASLSASAVSTFTGLNRSGLFHYIPEANATITPMTGSLLYSNNFLEGSLREYHFLYKTH